MSTEQPEMPPQGERMPLDATLITTIFSVGCVALCLSVGAAVLTSAKAALGVALGGLIATLNLWLGAYLGRAILAGGPRRRLYVLLTVLKFTVLIGVAYLVLRSGLSNALLLALGYGSMPIGITIGNLIRPHSEGGGIADTNLVGATPSKGIEQGFKSPSEPSTANPDNSPSESV